MQQLSWRNLTYLAIVLPAYLPLLATAVPGWTGYRRRYLDGWRTWLPAMMTVAALMAVLDAFSVAQGWWVFNLEYFTPPVIDGVPLAELMFFAGAVFFIRLIVVATEWLPRPGGRVQHPTRLLATVGVLLVASYLYAWIDGTHPRTVVEFGFMYVFSTLLLATTESFWRRQTWVAIAVALGLLFVMDSVMNGLGTFAHTPGQSTGATVLGLFPVEDIPYALTVIQLLIAAPDLWRRADAHRRAAGPAVRPPRAAAPDGSSRAELS